MKTLYTIYSNFAKRFVMSLMALMTIGVGAAFADETGTITFGSSNVRIDKATVTAVDDLSNQWTITTVGTESFTTNNADYQQVGSSSNPATSITFVSTLSTAQKITKFTAKFGGFSESKGYITLKVDDTVVDDAELNGTSDVTLSSNQVVTGSVLTVTITSINKGVKCYNISYTYPSENISDTGRYDFTKINGFSNWGTNYANHVVEYSDATVTFSHANKQSTTITNQPVIKGGDVTLVMKDGSTLANVAFQCAQWSSETQTITLYYSTNKGVSYIPTGIISENFKISGDLPEGTNAVKITFGDSDNRIGVTWCDITKAAVAPDDPNAKHIAVLVTDKSELSVNDQILIANTDEDGTTRALGADKGSNRASVVVERNSNEITYGNSVQVITLEDGTSSGTYAFNVGNSYLYAASSSNNYLKTTNRLDDNGSWTITIDNAGIATIIATGSNTRNWLRYNDPSDLFSCYASGQQDVSIYKVVTCDSKVTLTKGSETNATINSITPTEIQTCSDNAAERQVIVSVTPNAGYELNENSVTYNTISGTSTVTKVSVTSNTYTFQFSKDDNGEGTFSVSANPIEYTITFDKQDGKGGTDKATVTFDNHDYSPNIVEVPALSGYNFAGYYTQINGAGEQIVNANGQWQSNKTGYIDTDGNWIKADDITLYAYWTAKRLTNFRTSCSYTATWQVNGGQWSDGTTEDIVQEYNMGATITPPTNPKRIGYTFAGWDPAVPATMPAEDLTFTAIWENCRWVETDINDIQPDDEVVVAMETPLGTYTLDHSKGTGTYPPALPIEANGNEVDVSSAYYKNCIWNISGNVNDEYVLYPNGQTETWLYCTKSNYTVRVGTNSNNVFTIEDGYLKHTNLEELWIGYIGIYNSTDWRHYPKNTGNAIAGQTLKLYKRVCLEENQHWVTWNANGGLFADGSTTKTDFFTVGTPINHPTPTREGYTFTGWTPATNTMPNEDITLVAQWQINSYTVTWNANGGKFGNETSIEQSYTYGATITAPADPTRIGYTFAGWDPAPAATMPASHLTYNAQWNCNSPTDIKINGAYIVFPGETIQLTVTGNNIADDATYTWKKGDQIIAGQTTATLTIPNCVVGDAANYKCVVSNGTCSAENNFTVKMYRLRGLTDGDNWTTDFVFSKAEGNTATYEITLNGESNYRFKVFDGTDYYGNNEGSDNTNPTMTHDNCTNWVMQQNKGYDVTLSTTITGVYTFILNYTDESNPTISVIYPKKKTIYLNPNIWDKSDATEYYTVYSWSPVGHEFIPMEYADCNGKVYMAEIDAAHTQVIFIRYDRHVNNFDDKWNQTVDITLDANNPQYRIDEWENNSNEKKSYGAWELYTPYYSISYNMNGHGQSIGDICIKKDDIWIAPDDPSAVGYTFLGWRRPAKTGDNTLYKKGDAGFPVVSYEELTAQWSFSMEYAVTGTTYITSAVGQTIKATAPLTLTTSNMPIGTVINIAAPNIKFYHGSEEVTELTTKYTNETFSLTIAYTPTTDNTTEQPTITLSVLGNEKTFNGLISARSLPANFVIAAKWGNNWYAMPANMDSQSSTAGLLIEVDNPSDPTKALAAPNNAPYSLKSVKPSKFATQGERLVFVGTGDKTLYNAAGTSIQVYAQYANYDNDRYEWIPTTTDLKDYTLTSAAVLAGDGTGRTVSLDNHGIFGTLLQDKSYNGMVRLLPVDNFYEPIELQVVEWKQYSVSVMYTGAGTKYTTKVGNNAESSVQALPAIDHAIYSLSTSDLTTATNQPLIITIKDDADATIGTVKLTIPAVVATDKSSTALGVTAEIAKATSIVVLDGATLTADATKYIYDDVTVYPGGKLVIGQSGQLGMYTLTLRAGSTWGAADYEHKYPQFVLNNSATGAYSNTSGQINLDYVTTQDYYYPLSVPEQVTIADIKYPVEIYGSNVDKANKGSFQLKYYDGAQRVAQGSQYGTGWVVVDEKTTTTLTPNQGYAIWGIPKKINGTRQTYGIHRIPIKKAAGDLATNEKTNAEIPIKAHGINDANVLPNDKGWNYLGNPYLAGLGGMDGTDDDLQMGLLVQEKINGQWTGGWVNNGAQVRYVTLTNDCQTFEAIPVAEAQIPAFTTFFIQAAQDGAVLLTLPANVVPSSIAARQYAAQQETSKEITTGILLMGNDQTDRTGLLIADNFTEEYEFNADLSKFENSGINLYTIGKTGNLAYMAINQALAEQAIPVGYTAPAEGLYTVAFDEDRYNATDISALYLIDYDSNEKTNLLHTDYSFVTAAGTNNQRFALQIAFVPANSTNVEWVGDATIQVGVEGHELILNNLPTDAAVHVFDALGRLMYHTPHAPTEMQLTLPTGYYLVSIADKQHAAVINTVIP